MLEELTWHEFLEWRAYALIEPFGEDRADLRIGYAFAKMAGLFVKRGTRLKPGDFTPSFGGDDQPRTATGPRKPLKDPSEWRATLNAVKAAYSSTPNKKKGA